MIMQTIKIDNREWLLVEVPKDAYDFVIKKPIFFNYKIKSDNIYGRSKLVSGITNYTLVCTTDTITHELARGIVLGNCKVGCDEDRDYLAEFDGLINPFTDPNKTYVICKKNN